MNLKTSAEGTRFEVISEEYADTRSRALGARLRNKTYLTKKISVNEDHKSRAKSA
jgi:hypothetical protein